MSVNVALCFFIDLTNFEKWETALRVVQDSTHCAKAMPVGTFLSKDLLMHPVEHQILQTRREFLATSAHGIGALALGSLLT